MACCQRRSLSPVPSNDQKAPVVETPPELSPAQLVDERALALRIRQQEILAELGVPALRGTRLPERLAKAVRLAAQGREAEFCKVLECRLAEKRLLLRAGVGSDAGLVGGATAGADLESPS